jgi:hypothetical protein
MAARIEEGAESPSGDRLPPRPKARLSGVSASVSVGRSERYAVTCRVENAGHATWPRSSADGVGLVRPGAPLVAGDGKTAVLDYGRADLPRDLAPGASEIVAIDLTVPEEPGQYRLERDVVREGVAWSSSREPGSAAIALIVT